MYLIWILIVLISHYISSVPKITFDQVNGPIQLLDANCLVKHNGPDLVHGSVRVNQIYSTGVHYVRLSIEKLSSSSSSNAFIGIIDRTGKQSISSSHGWFIGNKQVVYQKPGEFKILPIFRKIWSSFVNDQSRPDIQQGDTIEIEIDCLNSKIELTNKRTMKNFELDIDLEQSPLPWQIIINLDRYEDRLRLQQ